MFWTLFGLGLATYAKAQEFKRAANPKPHDQRHDVRPRYYAGSEYRTYCYTCRKWLT